MPGITKVLASVPRVRVFRYLVLIFGVLYTLSSQALAQLNSSILHDDNKFTELSVYQDHQVGMVMINTKDGPEIITAYADNSCAIHGQLSIVKTSISNPESFSYLQDCISANSVDDVVLKKDGNDNVYVAYIENGSNNQIHLKWLKNGEDKFTDFLHSEQLTGKNPLHINLALNKAGEPVIVYTANDGKIAYLHVLKYENDVKDASKSGFIFYTPGQQGLDLQVSPNSFPRIAYNLANDLYIAYTGWQIGLVELDSNNKWSYISDIGNLPMSHDAAYSSDYSNAFDMVINGNKLYLVGLDTNSHQNWNNAVVYTYDTDSIPSQRLFKFLAQFSPPNEWCFESLKISVDNITKNLYSSIVTYQADHHNSTVSSYLLGIRLQDNKSTIYGSSGNYTRLPDNQTSNVFVLNNDSMHSVNTVGFGVIRYDDSRDHKQYFYKMSLMKNESSET